MFSDDFLRIFLSILGLLFLFVVINAFLFRLAGHARAIYVGILTFILGVLGYGDQLGPSIVGSLSAADYLLFRPFVYALTFLFASTSIAVYMVTTNQDRNKGAAVMVAKVIMWIIGLIGGGMWFSALQGLEPSLREHVYPIIWIGIGVGIVINLILGFALGQLPGSWIAEVDLPDSQKIRGSTIAAALVGFIAGYLGFILGGLVGAQIASALGWSEGAESAHFLFTQGVSYGSDIAILGGLLAGILAVKGKDATGSEGWTSGLKAGVIVAVVSVFAIVISTIPYGNPP